MKILVAVDGSKPALHAVKYAIGLSTQLQEPAHVTLISAIESEFGLAIDIGDSMDMTSFDAVLAYLEEHPA
jgi:nucleotide-binding universal stress UspA family protein